MTAKKMTVQRDLGLLGLSIVAIAAGTEVIVRPFRAYPSAPICETLVMVAEGSHAGVLISKEDLEECL